MPTFCIAEATKNVESKQAELRRIRADQLPRLKHELSRSPATRHACSQIDELILALAGAHDAITTAFWPSLREIVRVVNLLHPRPDTIDLTAEIYDALKLSPADSSVLASVIVASRDGICRAFMSRDSDFSQPAVREHMAAAGLTFFDSALPIVGPLRR
jgi:predicted nucleic acid-binding protein